jgi:hypothetical protein
MALDTRGFFVGSSTIDHELPPPTPESITDFSDGDEEIVSTTDREPCVLI